MAKASKSKAVEWKPISPARYREVMAELVHFSWKTVNSNITAGGVRLDHKAIMRLPYLSVRTMLGKQYQIFLDYQTQGKAEKKVATVVKQIGMARRGEAPAAEGTEILAMLAAETGEAACFGTDSVSPRMRQLLLPRQPVPAWNEETDYVAVSPVGCGGLNALVNAMVEAHNEQAKTDKELVRIRQANLPFGGSNPQNVGALAHQMSTPMFFAPPQENPEIRKALALHFKGACPQLPGKLMREWFNWFGQQKQDNQGDTRTNLATREKEADFARQVMQQVLAQGQHYHDFLWHWRGVLPQAVSDEAVPVSLLADSVDSLTRGWIEPASRQQGWANDFAEWISQMVSGHTFGKDRQRLAIQHGAAAITQAMREVLS